MRSFILFVALMLMFIFKPLYNDALPIKELPIKILEYYMGTFILLIALMIEYILMRINKK